MKHKAKAKAKAKASSSFHLEDTSGIKVSLGEVELSQNEGVMEASGAAEAGAVEQKHESLKKESPKTKSMLRLNSQNYSERPSNQSKKKGNG